MNINSENIGELAGNQSILDKKKENTSILENQTLSIKKNNFIKTIKFFTNIFTKYIESNDLYF